MLFHERGSFCRSVCCLLLVTTWIAVSSSGLIFILLRSLDFRSFLNGYQNECQSKKKMTLYFYYVTRDNWFNATFTENWLGLDKYKYKEWLTCISLYSFSIDFSKGDHFSMYIHFHSCCILSLTSSYSHHY